MRRGVPRDHEAATKEEKMFSCLSTPHDQPKPELPRSKCRQSAIRLAQGSFPQNGWVRFFFLLFPIWRKKEQRLWKSNRPGFDARLQYCLGDLDHGTQDLWSSVFLPEKYQYLPHRTDTRTKWYSVHEAQRTLLETHKTLNGSYHSCPILKYTKEGVILQYN